MASVLHLSLPFSHVQSPRNPSHNASDSSFMTLDFSRTERFQRRRSCNLKNGVICQSSFSDIPILESKDKLIGSLKLNLLSTVSGLNRGLAASEDDLRKAEAAAKELESAGGAVDLSTSDGLDKLQGRWKLVYSSAFSSRTLGGSRPGPPTGRLLPINLGQVFQRIDILSRDFDNIVELKLGAPWPIPRIELTACLAHKFVLIGTNRIKITFEKTTVKATGNLSQLPPLDIPRLPDALRPPSNTGEKWNKVCLNSNRRLKRLKKRLLLGMETPDLQ